jgi:uncharacterized RDD family membrane protein YckC
MKLLPALLIATLAAAAPAAAQEAPRRAEQSVRARQVLPPLEATAQELERRPEDEYRRVHTAAVRFGQDYHLRADEAVRNVLVINGNATLEGTVLGDIQVVLGTLRLAPTAVVWGSVFVGGGSVVIDSGGRVNRDLVIAGGTLHAPSDFTPGHDHFVIAAQTVVDGVYGFMPWVTEGLFLARPIVPRLRWVWGILAIVFFVSLALNLIFLDAVRQCAAALNARPLSTFLVGLLVLLLTGPVAVVLAASVVGLAVVPFLLCAIVIAWLIGKVGVAMWLGGSTIGARVPETRPQGLIAFVIGFALITIAYMVPFLGFVVYGLVGVLGLGAATLAFMSAYRRENPVPPKPAPPPAPEYPPTSFTGAAPGAGLDESPPAVASGGADASDVFAAVPPPPPAPGSAAAAGLAYFPKATFLERLCAFALDCALVLMVVNSLDFLDDDAWPVLTLLAYHVGFWTWKATTVGGIICQLRVVRVTNEPMRFVDALVRGCTSLFSLFALGLGCLWILRDPERQAWHDKVAGTYVVKVPRNWPL